MITAHALGLVFVICGASYGGSWALWHGIQEWIRPPGLGEREDRERLIDRKIEALRHSFKDGSDWLKRGSKVDKAIQRLTDERHEFRRRAYRGE